MYNRTYVDLEPYVFGKRVALVGPSEHIIGSGLGPEIDSYDIVARLGEDVGYPKDEERDIGTRTDIIFENFWMWDPVEYPKVQCDNIIKKYAEQNTLLRYVREPSARLWYFLQQVDRVGDYIRLSVKDCSLKTQMVQNTIRVCPTKGILAVYDLLTYGVKELFVCGITFYQKYGYKKSYLINPLYDKTTANAPENNTYVTWGETKETVGGHNWFTELAYFYQLACCYDAVRVDDTLLQLMAKVLGGRVIG